MEIDELAVKITGDSTSLQTAMKDATDSMGKLGVNTSALTGLLGAAGLTAALKMAYDAADKMVQAFRDDETAQLKYNAALAASAVITAQGKKALDDYVPVFASLAGIAEADTQAQIARLAAYGRTDEQIKTMMETALGMSNVLGTDVNTALTQINMTFQGTAGRLGQQIDGIKDLTAEQLKNGEGLKFLNEKYGQFSDTLKDSTDVSIKNFENAYSDFMSAMGKSVAGTIQPLRDALTGLFRTVTNGIAENNNLNDAYKRIADGTATVNDKLLTQTNILNNLKSARDSAAFDPMVSKEELAELDKAIKSQQGIVDALGKKATAEAAAADAAKSAAKSTSDSADAAKKAVEDALAAQIKGRKEAQQAYTDSLDQIDARVKLGLITEQDAADAKYNANKKLIDDLIALGYTGDAASKQIGDQTLAAAIARNANLYANTKENVENIIAEEAKILAQQKEVADWEKAYLEKKAATAKEVEAGIVADMISGNQAIVGADAAVTASLVQDAIDYAAYFTASEEARQAVMKDTAETMTAYNEQVADDAKKEDEKRKASAELVTADLVQGAKDYAAWFVREEEARRAAMLDTAETAIAYNNQVVAAEQASAEANKLVMADVAETQVGYSAYLVAEAEKAAEAQKLIAADMAETNVGYVAYVAAEEQKRHDTQIALGEDAALVNNGFVEDAIAAEKKRAKTSALVTASLIQDAADYVQYFNDAEKARQAVMADSMETAIIYNGQVVDNAKASADAAALVTADLVQTQTTYNQQIIDAAAKANDTQIALEAAHLHYSVTASGELVGAKMGDLDAYEAYLEEMRAKEKIADAAANAEKEKAFKDTFKKIEDAVKTSIESFIKIGTSLNSVLEDASKKQQEAVDAALKSQLDAYEAEKQAALEAAGLADKTTLETLKERVDAAYAAGDAEEIAAAEAALKKQEIIEEYDAKALAATKKAEYEKAVIKYKADIAQYGVNMALAVAQGALAIVQAFAQLGPIAGAIAAVAIGATTAAQIVVMENNKPTAPAALALGGVARGSTWVGERGAELVDLPAGSYVHDAQESKRIAADRGSQSQTFVFNSPVALTPAEMKRQFKIAQRRAAFMGAAG